MAAPVFARLLPDSCRTMTEKTRALLAEFDDRVSSRDISEKLSYDELRRILRNVPRAQRGDDWMERWITLQYLKRNRPHRTWKLYKKLRDERLETGRDKEQDAFRRRLAQVLHPYDLCQHGLKLPFRNRDAARDAQCLSEFITTLADLGYASFINSGTLLGAVREGQFVGHDDDFDVAVVLRADGPDQAIGEFYRLFEALQALDRYEIRPLERTNSPIMKILMRNDMDHDPHYDLFPAWLIDGKFHIWPYCSGSLLESDVLPLETRTIAGTALPVPRDSEKALALNYGQDWRIPDSGFVFPWADAREKFTQFLEIYTNDVRRNRWKAIRKLRFAMLLRRW